MSSSTPTKRLSKSKTPTKKKSPLSLNDTTEEDDTLQELHLQEASPVDEREPHTYQTKKKRKRKGSWDNRPIEEVFGDSDDDDDLDFESLANRELFPLQSLKSSTPEVTTPQKKKRRCESKAERTKPKCLSTPKAKKSKKNEQILLGEKKMEKIRSHFETIDQFSLSVETQTEEEIVRPDNDHEKLFLPLDKEAATSYHQYQELIKNSGIRPLSLACLSNSSDNHDDGGGTTKVKSPSALKQTKEEEEKIKNYYQEIDNFSLTEE